MRQPENECDIRPLELHRNMIAGSTNVEDRKDKKLTSVNFKKFSIDIYERLLPQFPVIEARLSNQKHRYCLSESSILVT